MIVETHGQSKLEKLKNKNKLSTVKIVEHILIGFRLTICYLEDINHKNECFFILMKIAWIFLLKRKVKSCTILHLSQDKKR